ncbi:helix-turn-helix transcriptional regulator [Modicisalibacter ilicicola]
MLNESSERYDPDFPKQIRLGASAVGWDKSEVLAWLEKRRQQRE